MKRSIHLFLFCILSLGVFGNHPVWTPTEQWLYQNDPPLPEATPLIEYPLSDISICKGWGNNYFLTGTLGDALGVNEGIRIWVSRDLKKWDPLGVTGLVWTFDQNGKAWQREFSEKRGWKQRAIVAPQLHYIKGNYWITYSLSGYSGILKSVSGKPEGPYEDISGDKPLVKGIFASLFEDTDGSVYFIWNGGLMHRMNDDMTGFASASPHNLMNPGRSELSPNRVTIGRINGRYYRFESQWNSTMNLPENSELDFPPDPKFDQRFDGRVSFSSSLTEGYEKPAFHIPHGGGGVLFESFEGRLFAAFSGEDLSAPLYQKPFLIPLTVLESGELKILHPETYIPDTLAPVVFVSREGNNKNGSSWTDAFTSVQRAVDEAPDGAQIWIARGQYDAPLVFELRKGLSVYGGFKGDETFLGERNPEKNKVVVNGRGQANHVISMANSRYIRLDGLTIRGGRAFGNSFQHRYGAGLHIIRGGETIRIVNCIFEDNHAEQDGGGLYASIGASPIVLNCVFKNNSARESGGAAAVYCNSENGYQAQFIHCRFEKNRAHGSGGALYFDTNQYYFGLLKLIDCTFVQNESGTRGIVTIDRKGNLLMSNCTLCFNKGGAREPVISDLGSVPGKARIVNSIFFGNWGGTLFSVEGESLSKENNKTGTESTIWVQFIHCLFHANEVSSLAERKFDAKKWETVSDLSRSVMGYRLWSADPGFVDPAGQNFQLLPSSTARGAGTPGYTMNIQRTANAAPDLGAR
ncbi:MAG TPA: family 43 glycosylhydrolase [Prolixibacteraceae bacterium]|nr:family 43 glycosylhydrolase [Prolixibacteraceae bacterium]